MAKSLYNEIPYSSKCITHQIVTKKTAESLFDGFSGYMQTDGYAGYNVVAKKEKVTQLGCWAHARRKFVDILKSSVSNAASKRYAQELVNMVAKLYKVEKEIKDDPSDKKKQAREEKSIQVINDIQICRRGKIKYR